MIHRHLNHSFLSAQTQIRWFDVGLTTPEVMDAVLPCKCVGVCSRACVRVCVCISHYPVALASYQLVACCRKRTAKNQSFSLKHDRGGHQFVCTFLLKHFKLMIDILL